MKSREIIQGLHTKLEELSQEPVRPLEDRSKHENMLERHNSAFENINTLDLECAYYMHKVLSYGKF